MLKRIQQRTLIHHVIQSKTTEYCEVHLMLKKIEKEEKQKHEVSIPTNSNHTLQYVVFF